MNKELEYTALREIGLLIPTFPPEWEKILADLHEFLPPCIIAGGALRDHLMGGKIVDLDIFVHIPEYEGSKFQESITRAHFKLKQLNHTDKVYDLNFGDVLNVWFGDVMGQMVQIIILANPITMQSICERCDFGICRIAYDGKSLFIHENFIHDYITKTFTLQECSYPESHYRRWQRFILRPQFNRWKLDAPQIKHLVDRDFSQGNADNTDDFDFGFGSISD